MKRCMSILAALGLLIMNQNMAIGEGNMIASGKVVKIHYTLTVDGQVVDSSEGKDPLEYTHGQQMIIAGLEKQLEGLEVGAEKDVTVAPEEGYGPVNADMVFEVGKERLAPDLTPEVGMILQMPTQDGRAIPGVIKEVKEQAIVIDFNHPLAGKTLNFKIKVVEIK